jgi:uncharacterized protein (DUF58 family)
MTPEELKNILVKVRNYEIRIRKAVNARIRGSFDSIFKGTGLEFDDLRTYQYGDDVRRIDWNASAKGEDTYIKVFKEEKEQTIFFLLDVSESQKIGQAQSQKLDIAKEICSVLALSAVNEGSEAGLLCYSDQKEKYIKPDRGMKKAYEIMLSLFKLEPVSRKTNLNEFIRFALELIKRRSIVFLISDFIDENYHDSLKALAKKHDLIVVHLMDEQEATLPKLGIVPLLDKESQAMHWVNLSSRKFRRKLLERFTQNQSKLEEVCKKYRADYLPIMTHQDFVPKLVKLFKVRNKVVRST